MGRSLVFATASSGVNHGNPPLRYQLKVTVKLTLFVMRMAAESGSDLTERSEKPGSDPISEMAFRPRETVTGIKGRNEQRRKSMSHPRAFSTSERESEIIDRTALRAHEHPKCFSTERHM